MHKYFLLVLLLASAFSFADENISIDRSKAWFKPTLTENHDPICKIVEKDAQDFFFTAGDWTDAMDVRSNFYVHTLDESKLEYDGENGRGTIIVNQMPVQINKKIVWSGPFRSETIIVSSSQNQSISEKITDQTLTIPMEDGFARVFTKNEMGYIISINHEGTISEVHKLNANLTEDKICSIKLEPEDYEVFASAQAASLPTKKLQSSLDKVMGGEGDCGTGHWLSLHISDSAKVLKTATFRPWLYVPNYIGSDQSEYFKNYILPREPEYYKEAVEGVAEWGLQGIYERRVYEGLMRDFQTFNMQLIQNYKDQFSLSEKDAGFLAGLVARKLWVTSFYFNGKMEKYSDAERSLRKLMVEQTDFSAFKKMLNGVDMYGKRWDVLPLAIDSPKYVQLLLKAGFNPNQENDFGKVPLMYAAQYNQLETAKLLLDAGADPNATTHQADTCSYDLHTFNMTPLHYATRYASPEFIKLLVDNGAVQFIKADNQIHYPYTIESPIDWLHRYTGNSASEKNPNIPDDQIPALEKLLQLPEQEGLLAKANEYILEAEGLYQKGNSSAAFNKVGLALQIQPNNERALSDMSLIALKNGNLGRSVEAGEKLIDKSADDKIKANAWFNQGLACERYKMEGNDSFLKYNGNYHCMYGFIYPYLKSLSIDPNASRKNKLLEVYEKHDVKYCEIPDPKGSIKINFQAGKDPEQKGYQQLQTLFVLHDKVAELMPEHLPQKMESYDLGTKMLSVFQSPQYVSFPYKVGDYICKTDDSLAELATTKP